MMKLKQIDFLSCIEFTFLERGFELTMLMIIGTDGIDSYKSNNHAITTSKTSLHEGDPPI
jgi:hypothetical protein